MAMASLHLMAVLMFSFLAMKKVAAMRMGISSSTLTEESEGHKTPDLDWEGCATWKQCDKSLGCHRHKVWLDTWRQSCRYSDEFKLREDQVDRFFPVEIARLEEKSEIFAEHGCLTGGWWYKCYRRMQQILRLFNYVRKAKTDVLAKGDSHPAYAVVSSEETAAQFGRISQNLATGFGKNEQTKDMCIHQGVRKMMTIPQEIAQLRDEAIEAGTPLTGAEIDTIEQAKQSAALLAMNCAEVSEEQEQKLRAVIEASGEAVATSGSEELDGLVDDSEEMMEMLDPQDRQKVQAISHEVDMEDDNGPDDHEMQEPVPEIQPQTNISMLQLSTRSSAGPLKMLVKGGWKGLKWLGAHGIGWLFRRLAWTIAFLIGTAFSLVRMAVWPILFVGCVAMRSVGWFFHDLLWEGKHIAEGFKRIGRCAPEMYDMVGFDSKVPLKSAGFQIFVEPAQWASSSTGVYHPLWEGTDHLPNPCRRVQCGANAYCQVEDAGYGEKDVAKCYCHYGTYPGKDIPAHDCDLKKSVNGCRCMQEWKHLGKVHYGCGVNNECKVDMQDRSYAGCKNKQQQDGSAIGMLSRFVIGGVRKLDTCNYQRSPVEVPAISIDDSIDDYGKEIKSHAEKK